ncbi:MAG: VWA domain-containing protein [Flavobacteriales bacterium]|nr:VWA domain-containing protein [Flavobacteriales bacterium]
MKHILIICFALLVSNNKGFGQNTSTKTRILFVVDASFSMFNKMGEEDTRMDVAKHLLTKMVDSLENINNVEIALRVYGHQNSKTVQDCKDTKLEVPFSAKNHQAIKDNIATISPRGTTLIAYSLQQAAYDFPTTTGCRNIIILITDGIEECNGDPCAVSQALQKQGVILKPFIIGVGLDKNFRTQFECVGKYFEASTEGAFEKALGIVVSQALNNTTCQINLLDTYGAPTETDVNISLLDAHSGILVNNFVHSLNKEGMPDTIYIDPARDYEIVVHTIPEVRKKDVSLVPGQHNIITMDAPQGSLELLVGGRSGYKSLQTLVYKTGTKELVHVQEFNTKEPYITGNYDLEILTLPRIHQNNVPIKQSKKTKIEIPQPGSVNIITRQKFWGDIYVKNGDKLEWVCNLNLDGANQQIYLQPGNYSIVFREKDDYNTINTRDIGFIINSGTVSNIHL